MPEHDCGGWCTRHGPADAIPLLRAGMTPKATATVLGRPLSTISNWTRTGRRMGCLPNMRQRGTPRQHTCRNPRCGKEFTALHRGTYYCSPECAHACKRQGIRFTERSMACLLGPAEPEIRTDWEGVRRRAIEAARDEVCTEALLERFPAHIADEAIAIAVAEGRRARVSGRHSGMGLSRLPFGVPL